MIRHVVLWNLAATDADARERDLAELVAQLSALVGVVPSIRALHVGPNVAYHDANFDVALIADFDDVAGLEAYQVHPAHQLAAGFVRSVVSGRASVDVEL